MIQKKTKPRAEKRSDDTSKLLGYPDPTNDFWYSFIDSVKSIGGQRVNAQTSQRIAAVFACETAIEESIAMLPITIKEQEDERTTKNDRDHYLYSLLKDQPNDYMDSFEFFEMMQGNALDFGNAFAHLQKTKSDKIIKITPIPGDQVQIDVRPGNKIVYKYKDQTSNKTIIYGQDEMFHFKPHTRDGFTGRTPIKVCADTVAFPLALQTHGNKVFENGAFLSGLLKVAHEFKDDEARTNFLNSFKILMGASNSGKFGLLEQGAEYIPFQMNSRDAQFLELYDFAVIDIARIFRMPPMMIQVMDKGMSFASSEQLALIFVKYTILPWLTRWERAIKRQLFSVGDEEKFLKFNVDALLRGDVKTRTEAIVSQLQYGLKTINEARNVLDDNPIDDEVGDIPLISHNLIPANKIGEVNSINKNEINTKSIENLFADTIQRMAAIEVKSINRILKKDEEILQRVNEFYEKHTGIFKDALHKQVKMCCELLNINDQALEITDTFISNIFKKRADLFINFAENNFRGMGEVIKIFESEAEFLSFKLMELIKGVKDEKITT